MAVPVAQVVTFTGSCVMVLLFVITIDAVLEQVGDDDAVTV
jgi:hypothetical protein